MPIEINPDYDADEEAANFAAIAAATEQIANSARNAEAVFRANAKRAAEEIVSLAIGASNERVRLDAAKYVVDRTMGRIADAKTIEGDTGAPWDGVYSAIVTQEPSAAARARGATVQGSITAGPQSQV